MRPKQRETSKSDDLFRARLDQIINPEHELLRLAAKIDWTWIDGEIAPIYSEHGRPAVPTRFMIGLLLLKHIYALSDEDVCERWVENPYFQFFTGEELFQHTFPHERSGLSHWRKRLGDKLGLLLAERLRVAHTSGALRHVAEPELGGHQVKVPTAIALGDNWNHALGERLVGAVHEHLGLDAQSMPHAVMAPGLHGLISPSSSR